jgi:5-formyltetrahydrofolate cyclo-ligase
MKASVIAAQKYLLRLDLRKKIKAIPLPEIKQRSLAIQAGILKRAIYRNSKTVFIYASMPHEVQTFDLIKKALAQGKQVVLPRMKAKSAQIDAVQITHPARDLTTGRFGILEPKPNLKEFQGSVDLVLVPGLGFDRKGNRLGRGLGYFDRLLSKYRKAHKAGLAFREQILKSVPVEKHDVPMSEIWTG